MMSTGDLDPSRQKARPAMSTNLSFLTRLETALASLVRNFRRSGEQPDRPRRERRWMNG
jgi:hypothetical protein